MPGYPWLAKTPADAGDIQAKMRRCARVGVPYTDAEIAKAPRGAQGQDRAGRADRVPAEPGPRDEEREVADGHLFTFLGSATTVLAFVAFIGIVVWAYSSRRKRGVRRGGERAVRAARRRATASRRDVQRGRSGSHERLHLGLLELVRHRRFTLASIGSCAWLLVGDEPDQGRAKQAPPRAGGKRGRDAPATSGTATSPSTTTRCRGGGCGCSGSPSCSRCLPGPLSRASARFQGVLGWTSAGAVRRRRRAEIDAQGQAALRQVPGDGPRSRSRPTRRRGRWASACSSTTARSATARTPAARAGFPTCATTTGCTAATPETIVESITNGRMGVMPALGAALGDGRRRRTSSPTCARCPGCRTTALKAQLGKAMFAQNCAACHGADGKGNQALGAPNLTDKIWLYGSSEATIAEGINKGRNVNVTAGTTTMPAFKDTLGPAKIQLVAAYVWGLSKQRPPTQRRLPRRPTGREPSVDALGRAIRAQRRPAALAPSEAIAVNAPDKPARPRPRRPSATRSRSTRSARRSTRARSPGGSRSWRWALVLAHAARLLRPAVARVERPPGGAVRPRPRASSTSSASCSGRRTSSTSRSC